MKKLNRILAIVLALALALSMVVPASAADGSEFPLEQILKMKNAGKSPATAETLIYPYGQTFSTAVVKGGVATLQFKLNQTRPSTDKFGVMICRGSYEDMEYLDESDIVEERTYKMSDFYNGSIAMTWKADSRYPVGDYILIGVIMDKNGEPYYQDYYAVDLYVVNQNIPATGMEVMWAVDGNYYDMPEAIPMFDPTCLAFSLTPYVNTASRNVTVTSSNPNLLTAYVDAGYVYVQAKGYGNASITITCGNVKKTIPFEAGEVHYANFHANATDPDLCVGMTDKIVVTCLPEGTPYVAQWSTTNPDVVTVKNGIVTAVGPGSATVIFTCASATEWVNYTVTEHDQREGLPVSERTATKPAMQVGPCSICGQKEAVTIIEEAVFTDTDYKAWYSDHVDYVYDEGIMNGTGAHSFGPDMALSRAMVVTVLYRAAGSPEVTGEIPFTDVEEGMWYSDAILWASQNEVVKGVGDGSRFDPNGNITREQIATILYRYTDKLGVEMAEGADLNSYPDGVAVSGFAVEGMEWAVAEGLITGVSSGGKTTLAPKNSASRAQLATIISRYQQMFPADSE